MARKQPLDYADDTLPEFTTRDDLNAWFSPAEVDVKLDRFDLYDEPTWLDTSGPTLIISGVLAVLILALLTWAMS